MDSFDLASLSPAVSIRTRCDIPTATEQHKGEQSLQRKSKPEPVADDPTPPPAPAPKQTTLDELPF